MYIISSFCLTGKIIRVRMLSVIFLSFSIRPSTEMVVTNDRTALNDCIVKLIVIIYMKVILQLQ